MTFKTVFNNFALKNYDLGQIVSASFSFSHYFVYKESKPQILDISAPFVSLLVGAKLAFYVRLNLCIFHICNST